jgi:uncharacterized protein YsxB (DUF464 family)
MVRIAVVLDSSGLLYSLDLKGHAGISPKGENPACAAITLLVRSVARLTASGTEWSVEGNAPEPGNLSLVLKRRPQDTDEWLGGVTDTLLQALADISTEFPEAVSVSIEEKNNGS